MLGGQWPVFVTTVFDHHTGIELGRGEKELLKVNLWQENVGRISEDFSGFHVSSDNSVLIAERTIRESGVDPVVVFKCGALTVLGTVHQSGHMHR